MTDAKSQGAQQQPARRRGFNLLEVGVISAFIATGAWLLAMSRNNPADALPDDVRILAASYGPNKHSEHYEEWIIRDFFQDRRGGIFLDVGANHYREYNNTYYLETSLGWSGIAVDPLIAFEADYRRHRPSTRFRAFFVSDVSNSEAKLYLLPENNLVTSGDKSFTNRYGANPQEITVPKIKLTDLLDAEKIERIDFMSMDIELHEPQALAGFDIARFRPALVCIEAHLEVRQPIIDYFTRHDYALVGKYLRADEHNLYFAPLAVGR